MKKTNTLSKKELKLAKDMIKSYESFLKTKNEKGKETLSNLVIGMCMPAYITAKFTLARVNAGTIKVGTDNHD